VRGATLRDMDTARALLRHTLATVAYRGAKTLRDAPAGFAQFKASDTSRTPLQILSHVSDTLEWGLLLAKGQHAWNSSPPLEWADEVARFFSVLARFDTHLAEADVLGNTPERLFQGPIADALTHVGQIAMLRRMAGAPVRGENYFKADIAIARLGPSQMAPVFEFD
jgi:hypothetical protein